jgi:hypothetical protein
MQGLWYKFAGEGFDPLYVGLLDGAAVGRGGGRGGGRAPAPGATAFLRPGVPVLPYLPAAAALQKDRAEHTPIGSILWMTTHFTSASIGGWATHEGDGRAIPW